MTAILKKVISHLVGDRGPRRGHTVLYCVLPKFRGVCNLGERGHPRVFALYNVVWYTLYMVYYPFPTLHHIRIRAIHFFLITIKF